VVLVIILICTNIFLVLVSQAVNKDNADLLLSGYNTMSKTEKENFKLDEYLVYFKKFFFQLALYSSLATIISYVLFDELTTTIIYALTVCLPLPLFIYRSNKNFKK
jgi:hypothetical protein